MHVDALAHRRQLLCHKFYKSIGIDDTQTN